MSDGHGAGAQRKQEGDTAPGPEGRSVLPSRDKIPTPRRLLITTAAAIALCQVLVMLSLDKLPPLDLHAETILATSLLAAMVLPMLYSALFRPMISHIARRTQLEDRLRKWAVLDGLTGVHNRRGFCALAEHQMKTAKRVNKALLVLFLDLDGMKQINDTMGHGAGDLVLIETARILKESFRETDIIARLGGDEFAVLTMETGTNGRHKMVARLGERIATCNADSNRSYKLSLSIGIARWDPLNPCSIDELLSRADGLMYKEKQAKRQPSRKAMVTAPLPSRPTNPMPVTFPKISRPPAWRFSEAEAIPATPGRDVLPT